MAWGLDEWADEVYNQAVKNGFEETEENLYQKMMLVVGELAEAQEELRAGRGMNEVYYNEGKQKPEGFSIELADALIRLLCLMRGHGISVEHVVRTKHNYNLTRPYMHGKNF